MGSVLLCSFYRGRKVNAIPPPPSPQVTQILTKWQRLFLSPDAFDPKAMDLDHSNLDLGERI